MREGGREGGRKGERQKDPREKEGETEEREEKRNNERSRDSVDFGEEGEKERGGSQRARERATRSKRGKILTKMKAIEASSRRQVACYHCVLDTACQTRNPGDLNCHHRIDHSNVLSACVPSVHTAEIATAKGMMGGRKERGGREEGEG